MKNLSLIVNYQCGSSIFMGNIQERYGRVPKDEPTLTPLLPVLGRRRVVEARKETMLPHSFPHYELIYALDGVVEWWVDGRIYTLHVGELLLVKPYEVVTLMAGRSPEGERYFLQFDLNCSEMAQLFNEQESHDIREFFRRFNPRVLQAGAPVEQLLASILDEHRSPDAGVGILFSGSSGKY